MHSADGSQGDGFAFGPTPEDVPAKASTLPCRNSITTGPRRTGAVGGPRLSIVLVPAGNTAAGLVFIDPQYYQVMTDWI